MSTLWDVDFREVPYGTSCYRELLLLREEVLRKPIGMTLRLKDTASDPDEYHLAAFHNNAVIGCVLLRPETNNRIQLRQMAIIQHFQGHSIGKRLIQFAENFAAAKGYKTIEMRARKTVESFYQKLGYQSYPNTYEDEHTMRMSKELT